MKTLPNPWSFMICGKTKKHIESGNQRPTWCPLREVPQKQDVQMEDSVFVFYHGIGYNACIDEILGGAE